jgi:hypothetical protein
MTAEALVYRTRSEVSILVQVPKCSRHNLTPDVQQAQNGYAAEGRVERPGIPIAPAGAAETADASPLKEARMKIRVCTSIGLAVMVTSLWAALPAAAQRPALPAPAQRASARTVLTLPTTGTFALGGEFKGTISISRFERRGNDIVAIGLVAGVLSRGSNPIGTAVAGEVAWPVRVSSGELAAVSARAPAAGGGQVLRVAWSAGSSPVAARVVPVQAETCPVLNVALGPLTVDLLGFQVALSAVTLDLTGVTGTPLGDLVCAASDLLGNVAGLVNLLNSLLGLVTGLLGGLTGGLGGAVPMP